MEFNSRLKGRVTQSLIECLLEDSGLKVMPLGIEEVVREVKALAHSEYSSAGISKNLWTLPDFFVSTRDMSRTWLVEVKYRRNWTETVRQSLFEGIRAQVHMWQPLHLAIFLGEQGHATDTPASYLRLVKLVIHKNEICKVRGAHTDSNGKVIPESYTPWNELGWLDFSRIQDVFPGLSDQFEGNTLTKATRLARSLAGIDLFDE